MILTEFIEIKAHHKYQNIIIKLFKNYDKYSSYKIPIEYLPKNSHIKINVKCDICGNEKIISISKYNKNIEKYNIYTCCGKCSSFKIKKTKLERYQDENFNNINKNKDTKLIRYNDEKYNNRIKFKDTCNNIFNTNHPMQNIDVYNKMIETKKLKYNDNFYNNVEKIKETVKNKYNTNCTLLLDNIKVKTIKTKILKLENKYDIKIKKYENSIITCECDKNHTFNININLLYTRKLNNVKYCTICNPINKHISFKENQLALFIKNNYNDTIIQNDKNVIKPYELDIYLPKLNLAFEFNGNYWHSTKYKNNNYHKNKSDLCGKKNIDLIHIFEFEWINNRKIVEEIILSKLKNKKIKIEEYLFEEDNLLIEDRRYNLKNNKRNILFSTECIPHNIGKYIIYLPGYNIYKK